MLLEILKAPATNDCGGCTACCDVIGVKELGKPYFARCYNVSASGCGIYADRPAACRKYRCAWHLGLLGDGADRRPDRCGVLFQIEPERNECFLEMYELAPDTSQSEKAQYLKEMILKNRRFRKLPLGRTYSRLYPHGSNIRVTYDISARYPDYKAPEGGKKVPLRVEMANPTEAVFAGERHGLLMPKEA
jgi:Fe-S-cluster containining protein